MNTTITRLTLIEREEISKGIWANETFSHIADRIGFDVSTVSREVWKNVKKKKRSYSAVKAEENTKNLKKNKGRKEKLIVHKELREYVYEKFNHHYINDVIKILIAENIISWYGELSEKFKEHDVYLYELKL